MNWTEFEQQYANKLTEQQKRAVQKVNGPVLLLAVPGSGKTTVLVTRLGYMALCRGIEPEKVLTVTYTVAATKDLAARCASYFGEELAQRFEFRTINGICAKIIQYYGRQYGRSPFSLASDEKQTAALLSAIYQETEHAYPTENDLQNVRTLISYIKNSMLTTDEIKKLEEELEDPLHLTQIYQRYRQGMRERRQMDYDDQMVYAYQMLRRHPELLAYFQRQYPYLCVDEAQDTSKIQHAILALLASRTENLFLVGDEDQSIYGFRAAYPQALLQFEEQHPGAEVLLMEENFRSTADIVNAANRFIQKNVFRHPKNMKAVRTERAAVREIAAGSRGTQYRYLAKVAETCARSSEPQRIAVLYRDNECALPLVDLLERNGTPYRMRQMDMAFFTHRTVLGIIQIFKLAVNPYDTEAFLQVYYKIGTYIKKADAQRIAKISAARDIPVLDAALEYGELNAHTAASTKSVRTHLRNMLTERADKALYRVTEYLGYRDHLIRSGSKGESKLEILRILASREATPAEFLDRLDYLKQQISEKTTPTGSSILLSTIHASKGLEYDTVYLLDVIDGILPESVPADPKTASRQELETYEEERRLFYVGMTRAKDQLYLFTTNRNSIFCEELFGKAAKKQRTDAPKRKPQSIDPQADAAQRAELCRQFREQFDVGDIVIHFKFGEGVILKITEKQVTIQFADKLRKLDLYLTAQKKLLQ